LSLEAQLEARVLMMSTNNVLSPANGAPIIVPSQDMVLGLYYTTMERKGMVGEGMAFRDVEEVEHALAAGAVHLHAKIKARIKQIDEEGNEVWRRFDTTPGRLRLGNLLPLNAKAPFDLVNRLLRKKDVQNVIDTVYRYCGQKESVIFCDQIMTMGFREAFRAGISFGKDDMLIPDTKWDIVNEVRDQVKEFEQQYMDGLITQGEKYNKVVDAWSKCSDKVAGEMMAEISAVRVDDKGAEKEPNSVYMMSHSGARGSPAQMKQLGGMRGLMAKPSGEIIETPIISNFKEGLTVLEYFNSTHGARKGLADTALKTANSGYLTRRLVDVAQDCIVRMHDCGTDRGITADVAVNDGEVVQTLAERVLGRVAADPILVPGTDEVIVDRGELIDERRADLINQAGVASARIRSPLTCDAEEGVCAMCYGRDLARGTLVNQGEAVGIIAAQSIGEPGTQLTMRTFHIGGIAQGGQASFLEASQEGKIEFRNANLLANAAGENIVVGRNMSLAIIDEAGQERAAHKLTYGAKVLVKDGTAVKRGTKLFEWDPYTLPIIAEKGGVARFVDLISGISVREDTDEATGMTQKIVSDWRSAPKGNDLKPEVIIMDKETGNPVRNEQGAPISYQMSVDAILSVEDGQDIRPGDVVARIPREGAKTKDITGGLPRVAELFEARRPKDHAIIAETDGYVRFG
ncbi:MAG: DNA-directed RNA polymerase subunit beta', partial [Paracoccaceae bacterium]